MYEINAIYYLKRKIIEIHKEFEKVLVLWFCFNLQQKNHAIIFSLLPPCPVGWRGESERKKAKTLGLR